MNRNQVLGIFLDQQMLVLQMLSHWTLDLDVSRCKNKMNTSKHDYYVDKFVGSYRQTYYYFLGFKPI